MTAILVLMIIKVCLFLPFFVEEESWNSYGHTPNFYVDGLHNFTTYDGDQSFRMFSWNLTCLWSISLVLSSNTSASGMRQFHVTQNLSVAYWRLLLGLVMDMLWSSRLYNTWRLWVETGNRHWDTSPKRKITACGTESCSKLHIVTFSVTQSYT